METGVSGWCGGRTSGIQVSFRWPECGVWLEPSMPVPGLRAVQAVSQPPFRSAINVTLDGKTLDVEVIIHCCQPLAS